MADKIYGTQTGLFVCSNLLNEMNSKIMKICKKTKIRVLNVNIWSDISYNASLGNFEKF